MYQSKNPFTLEVIKEYENITNSALDEKLDISKNAFKNWKSKGIKERAVLFNRVADLLEDRKNQYGELITIEMGKPINQAIAEVEKSALVCRYYAKNAEDFLKDRKVESTAKSSYVYYEPLGTVFAVMPWNFPFWQVFRFVAPAIMAGNTGLLKHASNIPQCANAIETVLVDAGIPKGVFQNLYITHEQVGRVISSRVVKAVTLTGSNIAGSKVAKLSGEYTKKTVLELGGSDPFIIFDDASLDKTVDGAVLSRFLNVGQSCIAAKRFIVQKGIADRFVDMFKQSVESLKYGNPLDSSVFVGPLVNKSALDELDRQVVKSIEMGAECITGGSVYDDKTNIYRPTLLLNPDRDSPVWKDEVFGPVAAIVTFETEEEAIELANDTVFGLGASVWTESDTIAKSICRKIDAGTVAINGIVKSEPGLPFGGINESGYGRELGDYGIREFVNVKTVSFF
jgi:succinate-semialdehyde dehydrogenase/glutarate-semialdehyde dehydrogenase